MDELDLQPRDVVVISAFDEVPEHLFRVADVYPDCVGGTAITGPLAGSYGEPSLEMILRVHARNP